MPYVIAAGGLGLIFYFRKDIASFLGLGKKLPNRVVEKEPELEIPAEVSKEPVVTIPAQTQTQTVKTLSPIGTPKENLQFDTVLSLEDKGQEVAKLQQILNRIAKIYGTQSIPDNGIFDISTQSKLNKIFGKSTISVREAYYMLFAIWNATENKEQKKWFNKYYKFYLTQPDRVKVARINYFNKNQLI